MTVDRARCSNHPDSNAEAHCPRCGSFVCPICLPDICPKTCIPCRSQLNLATESIYLTCMGCDGPMEAGYMKPIAPLAFLPFEGFRKYVNWPQTLHSHRMNLQQRFSSFLEEMTTWGNSWLRIDRCSSCCHVLIDYSQYCFTKEIKGRRRAGEGAHETPWKSDGDCPHCEQALLAGYLVRTFPSSFKSYEDFDRFFLWGYKSLIRDGIPISERLQDQLTPSRSYFHPMFRCEACRYAVLRYRVVHTRTQIKSILRDAKP
ncbi:MAG: hypothetical protein P1V97_15625 [Planctomycetota bacterium]|nr:hypothetical protein [Planctomycetota bacterium]